MKRSTHQTANSKETASSKLQIWGSKLLLVSALCAFGLGRWTSHAAQTTGGATGSYTNFEIIPKKNIFNPRRSPAYRPSPVTSRREPRTESLALVGIMSYGKGPMAFFDGSRSDYRKVLKTNDSIAGFKVRSIDSSSVKLASNTNEIEVQLGMQLAREEAGEWKLSMRPESLETFARATPMRSASQVNSERASEADQNVNPFANAIGNFFGNRGNGFPFPGAGNFTAQTTQTQPAVTPVPNSASQSAPEATETILQRLARQRQQETGEPPQGQSTAPTPDQNAPSPGQSGPSPQNQQPQPVPDPNGQPLLQPRGQQQPLEQSNPQPPGQPDQQPVDQSGQPIPVRPGQETPNQ
jgi:hypothetical protein